MAHITGGGYPDNLPRVLNDRLAVSLDLDAFSPPAVFSWLASNGGVEEAEMLRTFNCGFGMAVFVSAEREDEARGALADAGLSPVLIGRLVSSEGRCVLTHGRLEAVSPRVRTVILISGRGSNMRALIRAAQASNFSAEIVLVLSDQPGAAGLAAARNDGVAAETVNFASYPGKAAFEAALSARLDEARAEIVCLAGFMRVLSAGFVERWRGRLLNIHPSLLPDLRGLHTHQRAIATGLAEHGCTVHFVTAELDAGPIIAQARVPVLAGDDAETLAERVLNEEHRIYPQALDAVAHSLRVAQTCGV